MDEKNLSKKEKIRYTRHLMLPNFGIEEQLKIKKAKVLVIGAGGLGAPALQYLAAAGIGTLGIVDNDLIDQNSLARQVLYNSDEIGLQKAIIALKKLKAYNPLVNIELHNILFTDERALKIIKKYDIIIDCTDNIPVRYLLNDASIILNKPWVYAAISQFQGQLSVFNFNNGPSYRCLFPFPPRSAALVDASLSGVLGALVGVIGAMQAAEVIKMITGLGKVLSGKLLIYDLLSNDTYKINFRRIEENFEIEELINYEEFCKPDL